MNRRRPAPLLVKALLWLSVAAAVAAPACGSDSGGGSVVEDTTATDTLLVADSQVVFDTGSAVDTVSDTVIVPGEFGSACNSNKDCTTGWCVEGQNGYICTKECREECPEDFDCKAVGNTAADVVFLCIPRLQRLCAPCLDDLQCPGGACILVDGAGQCATGCDQDGGCPDGFSCGDDPEGTHAGGYCLPETGSCSCTASLAGNQRSC